MPIADLDCWDVVPALALEAAQRLRQSPRPAWFRIGDAFLEVVSDHDALFRELETVYGDCGVPPPPSGTPRIRCSAGVLRGVPLVSLSFDGLRVPDPLETARSPYRFLLRQRYVDVPGPMSGWRQLVNVEVGNRLLVASNGRTALVNLDEPEFAVDCIVGVARSTQAGVLFLHAASVGVAGAGALLIGPSRGGKSTTALTLAWRGHTFLGDDVAAVRLATGEILPFPRSAGLRDGPLARLLDERLRACRQVRAAGRHGTFRTLVRVSDLFPASMGGPLPLRFAFLLDGFADRATITAYRPDLGDIKRLQSVAPRGISPGRDLMSFLVMVDFLSRLRCHLVQLGSPEETASLLEAAMGGSCS